MKPAILLITILLILPFGSAGISDWFGKLTGKATSQPVDLEILVGGGTAPIIYVLNDTMTDLSFGPNEAPIPTATTIEFLAYDAEGLGNINDSTAKIEFSKAGETTRQNSCNLISSNATTKTYQCVVEMYWWDAPGEWNIKAEVIDLNDNIGTDENKTFQVGGTTGFVAAPLTISWDELNPGATENLANNSIILNNTGNLARNLEINSTNLIGLSDATKAIYSGNFSINTINSCGGTQMQHLNYIQISGANIPRGNYSLNDGTGQEEIFFCIEEIGSELTQQIYSTSQEGAWVMKITA